MPDPKDLGQPGLQDPRDLGLRPATPKKLGLDALFQPQVSWVWKRMPSPN
jgi:hypothetical protein